MTDYVVLFPADDEAEWAAGTDADHQRTYDTDAAFAQRLRAIGGAVTGGAGLAPSSTARTLPRSARSRTTEVNHPTSSGTGVMMAA